MTAEEIRDLLKQIAYPGFSRDIVSFGLVKEIHIERDRLEVRLSMATENQDVISAVVANVEGLLGARDGLPPVDVIVEKPQGSKPEQAREMAQQMGGGPRGIPGIARVVAVASGKGGVGKSTVAANLSVALARAGWRVGLLDADIYGPSIPTMFAVEGRDGDATDAEGRFLPAEREGVKLVSMGMFVADGAPLIWRGPMLTKALGQFLGDVAWGDLDYLILDLPPGTGDVQMTLTQNVALDGGVIVTTPQDVALADVERGVKMFEQASTPVLGVIENMSVHECSECGHRSHPFGDGGGLRVANRFAVSFLGALPLLRAVREAGDAGRPLAAADPDGAVGKAFAELARRLTTEVPVAGVGHA